MSTALIFKGGKASPDTRESLDTSKLSPEDRIKAEDIEKRYKAILASQYRREIANQKSNDPTKIQFDEKEDLTKANLIREAKKSGWTLKTNGELVKLEAPTAEKPKTEAPKDEPKKTESKNQDSLTADQIKQMVKEGQDLIRNKKLNENNFDKASEIANKILKSDPNNVDALAITGHVARLKGEDKKALEIYERVLSLNPKHSEGLRGKAIIYETSESVGIDHEKSFKLYEQAAAADPNNFNVMFTLHYKHRVGEGTKIDYLRAFDYAKKAEKIEPNNTLLLKILGDMHQAGHGTPMDPRLGFEYYQKAIKADPNNSAALQKLSESYLLGKGVEVDLVKAKEHIDRALKITPNSDASKELLEKINKEIEKTSKPT